MNIYRHPPEMKVKELLAKCSLPTSDITSSYLEDFFGCGPERAPEGVVGLELYGAVGLLRSLAVSERCRGLGYGKALVAQAERHAQAKGAKELYLLTTTAERFFERLGYTRAPREAAPEAIRQTREFSGLCPASSAFMKKELAARCPGDQEDASQSPQAARTDIPVIERVKIQAQVLIPLVKSLQAELGEERANTIVRKALGDMYRSFGEKWWRTCRSHNLGENMASAFGTFAAGDALDYEVLKQAPDAFELNVTRCRYAEFYKELGTPELGFLLTCSADFSIAEGFGPNVELTRTQTIMQGASHCDFRYAFKSGKKGA
jgi:N-acetylglutamate synthase-like GNAT family acetyltransferase